MIKKLLLFSAILSCFFSYAQTPDWLWARQLSGTMLDRFNDVATDAEGNSFSVGRFLSAKVTFGGVTLTSTAGAFALVKRNAAGTLLWAKSADNSDASGVETDSDGNSYITGYFSGDSIVLGDTTLYRPDNNEAYFLAKYDPAGNILWARSANNETGPAGGDRVAVDKLGNVYVTGSFTGPSITFGSITLNNFNKDFGDIFLLKYSSNGILQWAKSAGGTSFDESSDISTDMDGNFFITGRLNGSSVNFDSFTLKNFNGNPFSDFFLVKYNTQGAVIWAKAFGGSQSEVAWNLAVDQSGSCYVTGQYESDTLILENDTLFLSKPADVNGRSDIFLAKLSPTGQILWVKSYAGTAGKSDSGRGLTVGKDGNLYLTGNTVGATINFGDISLSADALSLFDFDFFVVKFDLNGTALWGKIAGNKSDEMISDIELDDQGNCFVVGEYRTPNSSTPFVLGTTQLLNAGSADGFLAKLGFNTVGIEEENSVPSIKIYPNPSQGNFFISSDIKNANVNIYNLLGELVYSQACKGQSIEINANLNSGMYWVEISNHRTKTAKRLVVY